MKNLPASLMFEKNLNSTDGAWLILAEINLGFTTTISNITRAPNGIVMATNHNLLSGQKVTFSDVAGMTEINDLEPALVEYIDENTFAVNIDTSAFSDYISGGIATLDVLRFVRNTEDIVYNGNTYLAFPFEIGDLLNSKDGELPSIKVKLSNVTGLLQPYLELLQGAVGSEILITIINSKYLSENYAELETTFTVLDCCVTEDWIEFLIGSPEELRDAFPPNKYYPKFCRYNEFKGALCKYSGSETDCNRTLDRCMELLNAENFGGFPGLDPEGIKIVG